MGGRLLALGGHPALGLSPFVLAAAGFAVAAEGALRVEIYPIFGDRIHKHLSALGVP